MEIIASSCFQRPEPRSARAAEMQLCPKAGTALTFGSLLERFKVYIALGHFGQVCLSLRLRGGETATPSRKPVTLTTLP